MMISVDWGMSISVDNWGSMDSFNDWDWVDGWGFVDDRVESGRLTIKYKKITKNSHRTHPLWSSAV